MFELHKLRPRVAVGVSNDFGLVDGAGAFDEDEGVPPTFHVPAHPGSTGVAVSRRMSNLKRRDNDAELAVRRRLHAAGYRYRVHYPVPGLPRRTIDIAFTRAKLAVFIDGCFWHGCPEHGTKPMGNAEWWSTKLRANVARDADTSEALKRIGWTVVRIWEHTDPVEASVRVAHAAPTRPTAGTAVPDPHSRTSRG